MTKTHDITVTFSSWAVTYGWRTTYSVDCSCGFSHKGSGNSEYSDPVVKSHRQDVIEKALGLTFSVEHKHDRSRA